jgi:hypothetical protein
MLRDGLEQHLACRARRQQLQDPLRRLRDAMGEQIVAGAQPGIQTNLSRGGAVELRPERLLKRRDVALIHHLRRRLRQVMAEPSLREHRRGRAVRSVERLCDPGDRVRTDSARFGLGLV